MTVPEKTRLGNCLHYLRVHAGYTHAAAAEKLHVTLYVYADYESGRLTPGLVKLEEIAQLYGVTFESLVKIALESEREALARRKRDES